MIRSFPGMANGEADSILVGCLGSVAWVRVDGSATQENAGRVRDFLYGCFEKGWRRFVVDLEKCRGIDSTFIGMLYRLAAELNRVDTSGFVELVNPGERNERSVRKLGLDSLIRIDSDGSGWEKEKRLVEENLSQPNSTAAESREDRAQLVLEAHEALIAANEENRNRFCDVVEFLRRDLEAQASER